MTNQLPVDKWDDVIGEPTFAGDAVLTAAMLIASCITRRSC